MGWRDVDEVGFMYGHRRRITTFEFSGKRKVSPFPERDGIGVCVNVCECLCVCVSL